MTPIPLDQLGFGWRSHKSAMWWLGLLYRRPKDVHKQWDQMPKLAAAKTGFTMYWHNLPYLILLCIVFRFIIFGVLGVESTPENPNFFSHVFFILGGIVTGIVGCIGVGIIMGIVGGIVGGISDSMVARGLAVSTAKTIAGLTGGIGIGIFAGITACIFVGITGGITVGITEGIMAQGIGIGIGIGIAFGDSIAPGITMGIAMGITIGIVGGIAFGIAFGIAGGIALMISIPRLYYFPVHLVLTWPRPRTRWFWWHPATWDLMGGTPYLVITQNFSLCAGGATEISRW